MQLWSIVTKRLKWVRTGMWFHPWFAAHGYHTQYKLQRISVCYEHKYGKDIILQKKNKKIGGKIVTISYKKVDRGATCIH